MQRATIVLYMMRNAQKGPYEICGQRRVIRAYVARLKNL